MAVYLVRMGAAGLVKIGSANNVRRRLTFLQAGNPEPLVLLREFSGGITEERWLQAQFKAKRYAREWFTFDERMLEIQVPPLDEIERKNRRTYGHVVALKAHLRAIGIDTDQFGAQFDPPVSGSAVRKWIFGSRTPRVRQLQQIDTLTGGAVTIKDFIPPAKAA